MILTVHKAVRALEKGDKSASNQLFSEVKQNALPITQETQYLLGRVSAVEKHYRVMEEDKTRKVRELHHEECIKEQERERKRMEIRSKEYDLQHIRQELRSVEEEKRRARMHREEAKDIKRRSTTAAISLGITTVFTLGLAAPLTVPGAVAFGVKAVKAREEEQRADMDIARARDRIRQCEMEIVRYEREMQKLNSDIALLSHEINMAKLERDRIHTQRGEITESITNLQGVLKFWNEFFELAEHVTHHVTVFQKFLRLFKGTRISRHVQQLQDCLNTWDQIEEKLEKGDEHIFSIDFTCCVCHDSFHQLPHLHVNDGKFCCENCMNM